MFCCQMEHFYEHRKQEECLAVSEHLCAAFLFIHIIYMSKKEKNICVLLSSSDTFAFPDHVIELVFNKVIDILYC